MPVFLTMRQRMHYPPSRMFKLPLASWIRWLCAREFRRSGQVAVRRDSSCILPTVQNPMDPQDEECIASTKEHSSQRTQAVADNTRFAGVEAL